MVSDRVHFSALLTKLNNDPDFFKRQEQPMYLAAVESWKEINMIYNSPSSTRTITVECKTSYLVEAVQRTITDLYFIQLRQNPHVFSMFKVAGLFAKHIMECLPIQTNDARNLRKINAHYAILIAIHLSVLCKNARPNYVKFNNMINGTDVLTQLMFVLSDRYPSGESLEMMFQLAAFANRL